MSAIKKPFGFPGLPDFSELETLGKRLTAHLDAAQSSQTQLDLRLAAIEKQLGRILNLLEGAENA